MLTLLKIDARGRVTPPKSLRKSMGLVPGDRLVFSRLVDGTVILRAKTRRLSQLGGLLARPNQPYVSIDEMRR